MQVEGRRLKGEGRRERGDFRPEIEIERGVHLDLPSECHPESQAHPHSHHPSDEMTVGQCMLAIRLEGLRGREHMICSSRRNGSKRYSRAILRSGDPAPDADDHPVAIHLHQVIRGAGRVEPWCLIGPAWQPSPAVDT